MNMTEYGDTITELEKHKEYKSREMFTRGGYSDYDVIAATGFIQRQISDLDISTASSVSTLTSQSDYCQCSQSPECSCLICTESATVSIGEHVCYWNRLTKSHTRHGATASTSTTISESTESPTAISESNELPTTISESNELPITISESNELPTNISNSNELPTTISESNKLPTAISESNELPTSISELPESNQFQVATIIYKTKQTPTTIISETKQSPTTITSETKQSTATTIPKTTQSPTTIISETKQSPDSISESSVTIFETKQSPATIISKSKTSQGPILDATIIRSLNSTDIDISTTNTSTSLKTRRVISQISQLRCDSIAPFYSDMSLRSRGTPPQQQEEQRKSFKLSVPAIFPFGHIENETEGETNASIGREASSTNKVSNGNVETIYRIESNTESLTTSSLLTEQVYQAISGISQLRCSPMHPFYSDMSIMSPGTHTRELEERQSFQATYLSAFSTQTSGSLSARSDLPSLKGYIPIYSACSVERLVGESPPNLRGSISFAVPPLYSRFVFDDRRKMSDFLPLSVSCDRKHSRVEDHEPEPTYSANPSTSLDAMDWIRTNMHQVALVKRSDVKIPDGGDMRHNDHSHVGIKAVVHVGKVDLEQSEDTEYNVVDIPSAGEYEHLPVDNKAENIADVWSSTGDKNAIEAPVKNKHHIRCNVETNISNLDVGNSAGDTVSEKKLDNESTCDNYALPKLSPKILNINANESEHILMGELHDVESGVSNSNVDVPFGGPLTNITSVKSDILWDTRCRKVSKDVSRVQSDTVVMARRYTLNKHRVFPTTADMLTKSYSRNKNVISKPLFSGDNLKSCGHDLRSETGRLLSPFQGQFPPGYANASYTANSSTMSYDPYLLSDTKADVDYSSSINSLYTSNTMTLIDAVDNTKQNSDSQDILSKIQSKTMEISQTPRHSFSQGGKHHTLTRDSLCIQYQPFSSVLSHVSSSNSLQTTDSCLPDKLTDVALLTRYTTDQSNRNALFVPSNATAVSRDSVAEYYTTPGRYRSIRDYKKSTDMSCGSFCKMFMYLCFCCHGTGDRAIP